MYQSANFAALTLMLAYGLALGAESGDAARGLAYSKKFCAGCYGVEAKDQNSPNPDALTFKEYNRRGLICQPGIVHAGPPAICWIVR